MGEIKQANFRINTETAAQFREFCEANGLNQAQGFDHIMQIAEMDKAKATIPERATEIEEFERHAKNLITAYLNSLEIAESTEERLLEQFRSRLESKDEQIIKLQAEVKAKEELATAANTAAMDAENKMKLAEQASKEAQEKVKSAEEKAKDKDNINSMLTSKLAEAENKLSGYDDLKASEVESKKTLAEALQTIKDMEKDAELALERAELAKEKAVAIAEKAHQEQLQKMYEKIENLQNEKADLKDAMSSVKQKNRELQVEFDALKTENERLRSGKN